MKTMLLAAAAALSLGIGSAYADSNSSGGTIPNTFFTQLPGVSPTLPAQHVPAATAQGGPYERPRQAAERATPPSARRLHRSI